MSFRTDDTFIKHLEKTVKLQGFITIEQLDERLEFITHTRYSEFLSYLDTASLIKLTPFYLAEAKHGDTGNFTKILPELLKRLEQQQAEIERLTQLVASK